MGDRPQKRLRRRDYLAVAGSVGFGGLAGCSGGDEAEQEDTDTPRATPEQSPEETPTETPTPEETPAQEQEPTPPGFQDYIFKPTKAAGEIDYDIQITAETTIQEVHIETEPASLEVLPDSESVTLTDTIEAVPGEINDISVTARTEDGGEQTLEEECYVREYEPAELNADLEFPPMYMLFWDGGISKTFEECAVGMPEVGSYSQVPRDFDHENWEAFETHFDQMQGHGINSVWIVVGHQDIMFRSLDEIYQDEVDLFGEMDIYIKYPIFGGANEAVEHADVIQDMEKIAEFIRENDNTGTIYDRPVIDFWRMNNVDHNEELHQTVKDEYGGVDDLFKEIRDALTVDGTNPFLIGNIGGFGDNWAEHGWKPEDDIFEAIRDFDGVHNGIVSLEEREGDDHIEHFRETNEQFIKRTREFADEFDLEFIPNVYNGFDTRRNDCWPMQRYFGRSPEMFEELIELAIEYRTVDVVHVWSWNEWAEGHMIEPGTWQGEDFEGVDYGTTYLEILEEKKRDQT